MTFNYSLLESSPNIKKALPPWDKAYPINHFSEVGACLQEPVFEIKEEDKLFMYWCKQHEDISSHYNIDKLNCVNYLSPNLMLLVTKDGDEEKAIFFTWLCLCNACNRKVDALRMKPITQNMVFKLPNDDCTKFVSMTFYPGVTSEFNLKSEPFLCQAKHLLYFSNFFKLRTWDMITFHPYSCALSVMDYRQVEASAPDTWAPPDVIYNTMVPLDGDPTRWVRKQLNMKPNMILISSDGKPFRCHKFIMCCHSEIFRLLTKVESEDKKLLTFHVPAVAACVDAFLKFIYFPKDNLRLESLNFENCCVVLELACMYQVMELIGVVSWILIRKMGSVGFKDVKMLQDLSTFLETVDNIQLVQYVKYKVFYTISRLERREEMSRTASGVPSADHRNVSSVNSSSSVSVSASGSDLKQDQNLTTRFVKNNEMWNITA